MAKKRVTVKNAFSANQIKKDIENLKIKPIKFKAGFTTAFRVSSESYGQSAFSKKILAAIKESNSIFAESVRQILDEAILDNRWGDGGIYDTGELKNSLTIDIQPKGIEVSYNVPYAALQHYGGYIQPYGNLKIDKVYIPGRPWIDTAFQESDFSEIYRNILIEQIEAANP